MKVSQHPISIANSERVRGIEPPASRWQRDIVPLNYTRGAIYYIKVPRLRVELRSHVFQTRAVTTLATSAVGLLGFEPRTSIL